MSVEANKCSAKNRQGKPCGNYAIPGGSVCRMHGGAAPQVKQKARMRLLDLVDPAIGQLARLMIQGESDPVKLRAIENILDRAGVPRQASVSVDDAREILVERILAAASNDGD